MTGILSAILGQNKQQTLPPQQQTIAQALMQQRPTLDGRWGNRQLSRIGQAHMDENQFQRDFHYKVGRKPGLLDYNSLADMFDGGGPGTSGDTFKGAPISAALNTLGVKPGGNKTLQWLSQQPGGTEMVEAVGQGRIALADAVRTAAGRGKRNTRRVTGKTAAMLNLDPSQYHEVDTSQLIKGGRGSDTLAGGETQDRLGTALGSAAQQFDPMGNKPALNDLAKRELNARENLQQLQLIQQQLDDNPALLDDVHTTSGRLQKGWHAMRDGLGIEALDLTPEQQQQLGDSAAYRQRLTTALNAYIKATTGATVGQGQETTRLKAAMPNEDDTPAQLIAKLSGAIENARMDVARFNVMRTTGASDAPSDAQLRSYLKSAGKAFYEEALRAGADPTAARMQAAQRLSEEFGL